MLSFYRISDGAQTSAIKPKLEWATKKVCLENFLQSFSKENTFVIADNVSEETMTWLKTTMQPFSDHIIPVSLGSGSFSFMYAVKCVLELTNLEDNIPVYFVEDDYIHTRDAQSTLLEGLRISDYCTGYDHPDKHGTELSHIVATTSRHWKDTVSTTMTFATTVGHVRQDKDIYNEYCKTGYPYDHEMFQALGKRGRKLISAIPAVCTHTELKWLSPCIDWQ
jgi:hypothetical protein